MRPAHTHLLFWLGVLVASTWVFTFLQATSAQASPPKASARPRAVAPPKLSAASPVKVHFGYRDFSDLPHNFDCEIDGRFDLLEELKFGYPKAQESVREELDRRLMQTIRQEIKGLVKEVKIKRNVNNSDGPKDPFSWEYGFSRQAVDAGKLEEWIKRRLGSANSQLISTYFAERGFLMEFPVNKNSDGFEVHTNVTPEIDFGRIAERERLQLSDCFDRFVREAGAEDDEQIITLLLAAFQDMPWNFPPDDPPGLRQDGFRVPAEVLRIWSGNCASKSTAFCSLWQRARTHLILVVEDVPEEVKMKQPPDFRFDHHALIGVEGYPAFDQMTIPWGLRRYLLCEVAGRERFQPGERPFVGPIRRTVCMSPDHCPNV